MRYYVIFQSGHYRALSDGGEIPQDTSTQQRGLQEVQDEEKSWGWDPACVKCCPEQSQQNYELSKTYFTKAYDIVLKNYGKEHWELFNILTQLGLINSNMGLIEASQIKKNVERRNDA